MPKATAPKQLADLKSNHRVLVSSLTRDPDNARDHNERNLETITTSLLTNGQVRPLIVLRLDMTIIAGNGTHEAMERLGWKHCYVTYFDGTKAEAIAYGLVDNRASELSDWNFERLAGRLKYLVTEENQDLGEIGWLDYEAAPLLEATWVPPARSSSESDPGAVTEGTKWTVMLTADQLHTVEQALGSASENPAQDKAERLRIVCDRFLAEQDQ